MQIKETFVEAEADEFKTQRFHNNLNIKKSHSLVTLSFHLLSTILARFTWHYFRDFTSERNRRNNMNQDILVTFVQFLSD